MSFVTFFLIYLFEGGQYVKYTQYIYIYINYYITGTQERSKKIFGKVMGPWSPLPPPMHGSFKDQPNSSWVVMLEPFCVCVYIYIYIYMRNGPKK